MQQIKCKYTQSVLIPDNGIRTDDKECVTVDGQKCRIRWIMTCDDRDGQYDKSLDFLCHRLWNLPFEKLRHEWLRRLGETNGWWHYVELTKI